MVDNNIPPQVKNKTLRILMKNRSFRCLFYREQPIFKGNNIITHKYSYPFSQTLKTPISLDFTVFSFSRKLIALIFIYPIPRKNPPCFSYGEFGLLLSGYNKGLSCDWDLSCSFDTISGAMARTKSLIAFALFSACHISCASSIISIGYLEWTP